jgi:hypothetical protein
MLFIPDFNRIADAWERASLELITFVFEAGLQWACALWESVSSDQAHSNFCFAFSLPHLVGEALLPGLLHFL